MSKSKSLTSGSEKSNQGTTIHQKKPLTVSQNDDDDISLQIETVSGLLINPTNPNAECISIHDIAWSLSRQPRFAGHTITQTPYNVAQHSVYVADLVLRILEDKQLYSTFLRDISDFTDTHLFSIDTDEMKSLYLKALLHDGHEAYTGDIPSPIKRIPELTETLKLMEMKLDHAIRTKFELEELTECEKILIKYSDKLAQAIEAYQFMPSRGLNWNLPKPSLEMLQEFPAPLSPMESYQKFIKAYEFTRVQ